MKAPRTGSRPGFTLVELMTAVAVLSLMMVLVSLLFAAASRATLLSNKRLDADSQARLIFDRMSDDFTRMLRRNDVDFHFVKNTGTGTQGANDTFFVYCEEPGYFDSTNTGLNAATESNMSLVGYRVYTGTTNVPADYQYTLERLAKGLAWDQQGTTSPVVYLTFDDYSSGGSPLNFNSNTITLQSFTPDSKSTIVGQWANIDQPSYADANFHLLGDSTFRLEYCFLLTDGTYSLVPARNYSATISTGSVTSNLIGNRAPKPSDGFSSSYGVGSRWYDTTNNRGYICTYAPPVSSTSYNSAVWKPLGMTDVRAVIVAVAILDQNTQKLLGTTSLAKLSAALADPTSTDMGSSAAPATPPTLMAQKWQASINQAGFAATVGLPVAVASQVRIYQRYIYLNNQ
jgi:prepilin-type N-terminal cleavage/methylation domain-containing protein